MAPDDEVQAIEVRLLLEAIFVRYGYDLRDYARTSMHRRALAALARSGFRHFGELQHAILNDAGLFATVLDGLTVRVSEMFRDPSFFAAVRSKVVPVLSTYPLLRVWHAGCASGEEVYAGAILLSESGLYERSQIYATDLSVQALEAAKQGMYAASELHTFASNYARGGGTRDLGAYYDAAWGGIAMKHALRRNVLFLQHDLVADHVFAEMHVIYCRNVLIYFGADLRARVLDKLAQSLCPGGFLCLGSSERLTRAQSRGRFVEFSAPERIYRYEGGR